MQKIVTNLWSDGVAEEAADFYTSLFDGSEVTRTTRCTDAGPGPAGTVVTVEFPLAGQRFVGINGDPDFPLPCLWRCRVRTRPRSTGRGRRWWRRAARTSSADGSRTAPACPGSSSPVRLTELLNGPDTEAAERVTRAMPSMRKLDVATLEKAYTAPA